MSKKSSTFAPDMKKVYNTPTIEIMVLQPDVVMDDSITLVDSFSHNGVGGNGAPRRRTPVF